MLKKIILSTCLFVLLYSCAQAPDMATDGGIKVLVQLSAEGYSKAELEKARVACMEILGDRLENMFGYAPTIVADSDPSRIRIEVPGARKEQAIAQLLIQTADLRFCETFTFSDLSSGLADLFSNQSALRSIPSFHVARVDANGNTPVVAYALARDSARINDFLSSQNFTNLFGRSVRFLWGSKAINQQGEFELIAVRANGNSKEELSSKIIEAAESVKDESGVSVSIQFTERGAQDWAAFTGKNSRRFLAVVLDNRVYSYPMVIEAITSGETIISGNFSQEEADDLASLLNVGSLPVGVTILSMEKVRGKGK